MIKIREMIFSALTDKYEKLNKERPYSGEIDLFKVYDDELQIIWDSGAISKATHRLYLKELLGDTCDVCGKPWKKVTYNHKLKEQEILSFSYYKQDCNCYPYCPRCGRLLYVEVRDKIDHCTVCGNTKICMNKRDGVDEKGKKIKIYCKHKKIPTLHGWKCPVCDAEKPKQKQPEKIIDLSLPYAD